MVLATGKRVTGKGWVIDDCDGAALFSLGFHQSISGRLEVCSEQAGV